MADDGGPGRTTMSATHADEVRRWADADPAVSGGTCTYEVHPMGPSTIRPQA